MRILDADCNGVNGEGISSCCRGDSNNDLKYRLGILPYLNVDYTRQSRII